MKRTAKAVWKGTGSEGNGKLTTQSHALSEHPYSFKSRFEDEEGKSGTNPDELIAAAHAGCFAMALGVELEGKGFTPETIDVHGRVTIEKEGEGFAIKKSHLDLKATVPGLDMTTFQDLANAAKDNCPVSKALACDISMTAHLEQ